MYPLALHQPLLVTTVVALLAIGGCRALVRDCGTIDAVGCHDDEVCDQSDPSVAGTCVTACPDDRIGALCDDGRVCVELPAGAACISGGLQDRGQECDAENECVTGAVCEGTCTELCDSRHACSSGTCELELTRDRGRCIGP
jgi:hypothetical protein